MLAPLDDLVQSTRVVELPLVTPFRGLVNREALLCEGPNGWSEFSPFIEYDDAEASLWLAAMLDFGWGPEVQLQRTVVRVNATIPAVDAADVAAVLERFPGCRTVKVKVAERGQRLTDDVARVREVRRLLGATGRIRIDANGSWNVDEAEHAVHLLAEFDLEYVEQPCSSVEELGQLRARVKYMGIPVAADESVRKASDPLAVVRAGAADLLVFKAPPLGGVTAALALARDAALPVIVSSALDTSVGISMGLHLAGGLAELDYDCGLGTAALLGADVTATPLVPVDGVLEVRRVAVDTTLVDRWAASPERTRWWIQRLERCYRIREAVEAA